MVVADGGDPPRSAASAALVTADLLLMSAHGRVAAEGWLSLFVFAEDPYNDDAHFAARMPTFHGTLGNIDVRQGARYQRTFMDEATRDLIQVERDRSREPAQP